ncbi:MAG TPA: A/G-specific adenine glycosylase [Usitatibacter sp.]|nr:A/G-specific adenine glycosylase [Usitatibacter sp.]
MPRARKSPPRFSERVIRWQATHGRHGLPWQGTRDAYRVWLSEVMLQQTQVATVIPYYERFLARFPDVRSLAAASADEVLALWSGLGYYARARNLHQAAQAVAEHHGGRFPATFEALEQLPGIGRSTAGAIAAFAGGERRAILDGNVRRVLARHAGIGGDPSSAATLGELWGEAEARLPASGIEAYTQGMMDLGADVCLAAGPLCLACPVNADCVARNEGRIAELPGRRARREKVRRRVAMLVVISKGEVLLEKRPPTGIWGGLWSLPEASAEVKPAAALERDWGIEDARIEALEPFEHAFTHFTLEILPWRVHPTKSMRIAEGRGAMWMPVADIDGAALPSPVKKLLSRLLPRA